MRYTLLIITLLYFGPLSAQSNLVGQDGIADDVNNSLSPLTIGTTAPEIKVENFILSNALKQGPVVLIFYRGFWCPYCTKHLEALEEDLQRIRDLGGQVIAITPEGGEGIEKTRDRSEWSSKIIHDQDRSIMSDYGVLFRVSPGYDLKIKTLLFTDIASNNEEDEAYLPIPATYVIGQDAKIKYVHHDSNYRQRASIDDIVGVLESL